MANNNLAVKAINNNLEFVKTDILSLIEVDFAKNSAVEVVERLQETVSALLDENANNKEQLSLIWGTLTSDPAIIESLRQALLTAVSTIDDEKVKNGLNLLVQPLTKTIVAVTDQVKPDGEQIKTIWVNFVQSPEFLMFLLSNLDWVLSKVIKDKKIRDFITKLIGLID